MSVRRKTLKDVWQSDVPAPSGELLIKHSWPKASISPVFVGKRHAGKRWRITSDEGDVIVAAGYVGEDGYLKLYDMDIFDPEEKK